MFCNHQSHNEIRQYRYYNRNEGYLTENWSGKSFKSFNNNANKKVDHNNNQSAKNIPLKGNFNFKHDNVYGYQRERHNYQKETEKL